MTMMTRWQQTFHGAALQAALFIGMAITGLALGGHPTAAAAAEGHAHGHTRKAELFVSNLATNVVLRFNGQTGTFVDTFVSGGGLAQPGPLTFGPDENLYVASIAANS